MISLEQTRKYKLNRDTMVIIKSRRDKDAEIYRTSVSLIHESADINPLELKTQQDVIEYITGIDLEDNQTSLLG